MCALSNETRRELLRRNATVVSIVLSSVPTEPAPAVSSSARIVLRKSKRRSTCGTTIIVVSLLLFSNFFKRLRFPEISAAAVPKR